MVQQVTPPFSLFNTRLYPQWLAAAGVVLLLSQLGAMCGWTSPYLAKLTVAGSEIPLTLEEASWVASLLNVGRFIGALLGSLCVHYWGSKKAIVLTLVPISVSWILIIVATQPLMLYLARVFGGTGLGMAFSCFPLYIGEIALPEIRGALVTISFCGSPFGNMIVSTVGNYLSMRISGVVFLIPSLVNIMLFIWLPDSPHNLVKLGKLNEAKDAIHWYRNGNGVEDELEAVQKFVSSSTTKSLKEKLDEFKSPPIKKALFIATSLFVYMQISGLNSLIFYAEMIFVKAKVNLLKPSVIVMLIGILGAATSILSVNLMDKCGRRILLLASGSGVTVSMLMLGTHFMLIDYGLDPLNFQWLPIASVIVFMVAFVFGLMPVPSAVLSEIFPVNIKCIAACMASLAGATFAFGATKTYQPMVETIGEAYVFYIHAILTITIIPFVLLCVPETKGKSLQEIQDLLNR